MHGSPTTLAALAILYSFVARWYAYVLQLHTSLEVALDHGWGGASLELAVRHLKVQEQRFTYSLPSPWYGIVLRVIA